jgi:hypothetical protein
MLNGAIQLSNRNPGASKGIVDSQKKPQPFI